MSCWLNQQADRSCCDPSWSLLLIHNFSWENPIHYYSRNNPLRHCIVEGVLAYVCSWVYVLVTYVMPKVSLGIMVRKILWLLTAQVSNGKSYQNRIVLSTRNKKKTQFNRPICTVWWQSYPQANAAPVIDNSKNIPFFRPPNWCRWPLKLICSSFFVFISQDWMVKNSSWASLLCYFAGILMQARASLRIHHHHWRGLSKVANQSVGHIRGACRKRMILSMCTHIWYPP